ncbi:MAG: D-alanyl-D-alanine carboxypeptidase family protein [Oscillospiraceae bacterium]
MKKLFRILLVLLAVVLAFPATLAQAECSVSAQSAILINAATGTVIYSKNPNAKMPMASTTKIMTGLILAEQETPERQIKVTREMVTVEGSSMGLMPEDTISFEALLAGLLLCSGNDAANTIAMAIGGNLENFAKIMNHRALRLHMDNTNFVTPSGLDHDEHYTTAYDMSLLAREAMSNKLFRNTAGSKAMTVSYGNPPYKRTLTNHNKLLSLYSGAIGVKTGFTQKSGRCLVSMAERDSMELIAVTLNAPDDWNDHIAMFEYGFKQLEPDDITYQFTDDTLPVVGGTCQRVRINVPIRKIGLMESEKNKISSKVSVPPFVYAPTRIGDKIGEVTYYMGKTKVSSDDILLQGDIEVKYIRQGLWERLWSKLKMLLKT